MLSGPRPGRKQVEKHPSRKRSMTSRGAVLLYDGLEPNYGLRPVAFASHTLTQAGRNYMAEKDCRAIIFTLKKFAMFVKTCQTHCEN